MVKSLMQIEALRKEILKTVKDPRRTSYGHIKHRLEDIIIIALCRIAAHGNSYYNEIQQFGEDRKEWFQSFLELPNGIPDGDTIRRVFCRVDAGELLECLSSWLVAERGEKPVIAKAEDAIQFRDKPEAYRQLAAFVKGNKISLEDLAPPSKAE